MTDAQWATTFAATGNYLLANEAKWVFNDQKLSSTVVLTSSANAVVSKFGSEAYDVSKTALNHLIRELAVGMAWRENASRRYRGGGFHHVPARSRDAVALRNIRSLLTKLKQPKNCVISWQTSTRSGL